MEAMTSWQRRRFDWYNMSHSVTWLDRYLNIKSRDKQESAKFNAKKVPPFFFALFFYFKQKTLNFSLIYFSKVSLHLSILCIVKIEWKPEDVVFLKRSKKDIKNVDHMMINHGIATVREFMFCKVRVWKGYFCNWLRKNWPQNIESPHRFCSPH